MASGQWSVVSSKSSVASGQLSLSDEWCVASGEGMRREHGPPSRRPPAPPRAPPHGSSRRGGPAACGVGRDSRIACCTCMCKAQKRKSILQNGIRLYEDKLF